MFYTPFSQLILYKSIIEPWTSSPSSEEKKWSAQYSVTVLQVLRYTKVLSADIKKYKGNNEVGWEISTIPLIYEWSIQ